MAQKAQQQEPDKLSPEELKIVETAVQAAGNILYSDKVAESVANQIKEPPHTPRIGAVSAQITKAVDEKMDLPEDLIIPTGVIVTEMVSDIGEELGFYKENKDHVRKSVNETIKNLMKMYGIDEQGLQEQAESVSPDELSAGMKQAEADIAGEGTPTEVPAEPAAEEAEGEGLLGA